MRRGQRQSIMVDEGAWRTMLSVADGYEKLAWQTGFLPDRAQDD